MLTVFGSRHHPSASGQRRVPVDFMPGAGLALVQRAKRPAHHSRRYIAQRVV